MTLAFKTYKNGVQRVALTIYGWSAISLHVKQKGREILQKSTAPNCSYSCLVWKLTQLWLS